MHTTPNATGATLIRVPAVLALRGSGRTKLFEDENAGCWPPAIKLSKRWKGYPLDECIEVNRARIAGASDDDVRRLVRRLVEARQFKRGAS